MTPDSPRIPVTLSLADCARATGLSVKAIRRRIERGTLESMLIDGRRRIPVSVLVGAGLLVKGLDRGQRGATTGHVQPGAVVRRLASQQRRLTEELAAAGELEADVRRIVDQLHRERLRSRELEEALARAQDEIRLLERALRSSQGR
jgi:hypothetical protein